MFPDKMLSERYMFIPEIAHGLMAMMQYSLISLVIVILISLITLKWLKTEKLIIN